MGKIYGYCRISTKEQSIERQHRNIQSEYPSAILIDEIFTGTKIYERKEFNKLLKNVIEGDAIVFDSVSRMSRDSNEGFKLYEELFNRGVELVFLKEKHINTSTYKKALSNNIVLTGTNVDFILEGVNKYLMALAKEQIKIAFDQSEKEVMDLRQRTKEGLETARLNGKQIGQKVGIKLIVKKKAETIEKIKFYSRDFNGTLKDDDVIKLTGVARNTYYKYKKELTENLNANIDIEDISYEQSQEQLSKNQISLNVEEPILKDKSEDVSLVHMNAALDTFEEVKTVDEYAHINLDDIDLNQ